VPHAVTDIIRDAHIARARGIGDALDGHALFTREKVAAALAVLDGRDAMTLEDWELSGVVMTMSNRTRADVESGLRATIESEAREYGARLALTNDEREIRGDKLKRDRVSRVMLRALERAGGSMTKGRLVNRVASRDRDVAEESLMVLIAEMRVFRNPSSDRIESLPGGLTQ
jgi:hypothetical protein